MVLKLPPNIADTPRDYADPAGMTDRELLEAVYRQGLEVQRLFLAWQSGGLKGLRQARRG